MVRLFRRQARKREQRDELLSAYVDGQLGAGERARLEAQLVTDPALRAELDALRHTVALVRDLPTVPIPRNFILPQTMAARRRPAPLARPRRAWAAPLLTAATAVVSLIFVVVLAGDLLLSGVGGRAFAPAAAPLEEVEAPQIAEVTRVVEVEEVEVEGEGEVEKAIPAATLPPMPMEAPLEAEPEATIRTERYAAETPEDAEATAPAMAGGPAEENAAVPTTPATATAAMEKGVNGAEPTPDEVAQVVPPAVGEEEAEVTEGEWGVPESEAAGLPSMTAWRVLEIILGLTTLGLAMATFWAWRAHRR